MHVAAACDPVTAIRQNAREQRAQTFRTRVWRMLMEAWMRRLERQVVQAELKAKQRPTMEIWWSVAAIVGDRRCGQ